MKLLYLNNYFYMRGGSERVFFGEMELVKKNGHEVTEFARKHPENFHSHYSQFFPPNIITNKVSFSWSALKTVMEMMYSKSSKKGLDLLLKEISPDLAHVHNMYGRLTTSVLDLMAKKKIPVVMTLHDHKLICPTYLCMRNGSICEDCGNGNYFGAVTNRCLKDSFAASAVVALESYYCNYFDKYRKNIRFFISPSMFLRNKLVKYGWPENRIRVIPNFINLSEFTPNYNPGKYFLYLGRLSEEKGIKTLIQVFKKLESEQGNLLIVGDGPLRYELEAMAKGDNRIRFAGYLAGDDLRRATQKAKALIIPSECYENAPLSVIEAMAYGKPVICSAIGGIPEMVSEGENGYTFPAGNVNALKLIMEKFITLDPLQVEELGRSARNKIEENYTSEAHYQKLMEIYDEVLNQS